MNKDKDIIIKALQDLVIAGTSTLDEEAEYFFCFMKRAVNQIPDDELSDFVKACLEETQDENAAHDLIVESDATKGGFSVLREIANAP